MFGTGLIKVENKDVKISDVTRKIYDVSPDVVMEMKAEIAELKSNAAMSKVLTELLLRRIDNITMDDVDEAMAYAGYVDNTKMRNKLVRKLVL